MCPQVNYSGCRPAYRLGLDGLVSGLELNNVNTSPLPNLDLLCSPFIAAIYGNDVTPSSPSLEKQSVSVVSPMGQLQKL